jgi:hypothetical protein
LKANLKRKLQIARELAADGLALELENLNEYRRPDGKPRKFTVELTKQQQAQARAEARRP